MQLEKLIVSSSPHIRSGETVQRIMFDVVIALIPALIASIIFFGLRALLIVILTVVVCIAAEAICQKVLNKPITISDGSAIVTGILLAFNFPPTVPLYIPIVGGALAIVVAKQIFGGLGHNPFNPALAARAFLVASWPAQMTNWINPDGSSAATPLGLMKLEGIATPYWDLFIGNIGGCLGETSALALLIGGAYLLYRGHIDWRIPVGYLGTVAVLSLIFSQDPLFYLLSGGLMLGALFMATDMVTTPITKRGRLVFGIGCGIITVLIRLFGGYPEGVSYSILLMNALTPLIDRYTKPRTFGKKVIKNA
jgi:electron transport complex protein RnfD